MTGQTEEQITEIYRELAVMQRKAEWTALRRLWSGPVVQHVRKSDGVTIYSANREEEWTFWRAVRASIGIVLRRYSEDGRGGLPLAFWNSHQDGYGYSFDYLTLYPGCRVEVASDGETWI